MLEAKKLIEQAFRHSISNVVLLEKLGAALVVAGEEGLAGDVMKRAGAVQGVKFTDDA